MSDGTVYRATADHEVTGRTIEGLALPWDTWQTVRDLRGPAYEEAHSRSSLDVNLRSDPGPRPLFSWHDYATSDPAADPIGAAQFMRSEHGLMFRGWLSKTRKADEQLELIKDGAKRAVSVALDLLQHRDVRRPKGVGRLRTESRLRELSIAPSGFGQFPQAQILALRAQGIEVEDDEELPPEAEETELPNGLVVPPARDQLLRMRARRPLLRANVTAKPAPKVPVYAPASHLPAPVGKPARRPEDLAAAAWDALPAAERLAWVRAHTPKGVPSSPATQDAKAKAAYIAAWVKSHPGAH